MLVLGIDPGSTTGIAVVYYDPTDHSVEVMETHQLQVKEATLWIRREISERGVALIGMEKYIITQRTAKLSRQTDALEMIGVVKSQVLFALTDSGREIPISMHSSSDGKNVWSNPRLVKHDLYRHATGHARDGLRHALLALERTHHSIS